MFQINSITTIIMSLKDYDASIEEYQWKTPKHYGQSIEGNHTPRSTLHGYSSSLIHLIDNI
jgi:hypothetical protein